MIPKEKAKQLIKMFQFETEINEIIAKFNTSKAKECALIAVDLILQELHIIYQHHERNLWEEVKQEIKDYKNIEL